MRGRKGARLALAIAALCAVEPAGASVQVDPIARLTLEGGYDSNILYDGRGDRLGRVSPDLGLSLRDHTWAAALSAGGDLLDYGGRSGAPVWNQRGRLLLRAAPERRLAIDLDTSATYVNDPVGLARLAIIGRNSAALLVRGDARVAWRAERDWKASATYHEALVRFGDGTGAAAHTPGVELVEILGQHLEAGGAFKTDFFQGFDPATRSARAYEASAVVRARLSRRLTVQADGGPALWTSGGSTSLLPQAGVELLAASREGDARLSLRHGVGLGLLATPGLADTAEGAFTWKVGRSLQLHADGGLWRSGEIPWGRNGATGYGVQGEVGWRFTKELLVGLGASRFARADVASSLYDRNIVGLRVAWELRHR